LRGTDFEPYHDTYCGAWERLTLGIRRAAACNIGVLIGQSYIIYSFLQKFITIPDLHAAPGKQNNDAHAGTSGPANFFNDSHNQKATIHALCSLVENLREFTNSFSPPLSNIIGIELLNEPSPPSDRDLKQWYNKAISSIRSIDPTIPIYIGDCWRPDVYADYMAEHPASTALTVVDHHLYRCFTASDTSTSAEAHSRALADPNAPTPQTLASAAEKAGRAGGGIVIGEWSGALNPGSLRGIPHEQRDFVQAELALFERVCAGWFFWTYKKECSGDTGWSLRDAVQADVVPRFVGIKPHPGTIQDDGQLQRVRDSMRDQALGTL
jgi:glucan 1,3-beta-glucosidase